jgi:hypothetical protein
MLDLSDQSISSSEMQALMNAMYKSANIPENSDIDFEMFSKLFASDEYESTLRKATLGIEGLHFFFVYDINSCRVKRQFDVNCFFCISFK